MIMSAQPRQLRMTQKPVAFQMIRTAEIPATLATLQRALAGVDALMKCEFRGFVERLAADWARVRFLRRLCFWHIARVILQ